MSDTMNLYVLDAQPEWEEHTLRVRSFWPIDCATGFVILAESPTQARNVAADCCGAEGKTFWLDNVRSRCRLMGTVTEMTMAARISGFPKVLQRSFHAG